MGTPENKPPGSQALNNLFALFELLAKKSTSMIGQNDLVRWITTENSTWPNLIFRTMPGALHPQQLAKQVTDGIRKGIICPYWMIPGNMLTVDLEQALQDQGMVPLAQWPCISMELDRLQGNDRVSSFEINRVNDIAMLNQWVSIAGAGFRKLDPLLFEKVMDSPELVFYLGLEEGKPVCCALAYDDESAAGIHHVATLPGYRKRGFGSAMFRKAMADAKLRGLRSAVAQSTVEALGVWTKLGFEEEERLYLYWMADKQFR